MIQLILYSLIFYFIYSLQKRVKVLQEEVALLKRLQGIPREEESAIAPVAIKGESDVITEEALDNEIVTETTKSHAQNREAPATPSPASAPKLIGFIKHYFTEGNILVRIGGIILFFGLAFLVKYAAEQSTLSIEIRLAGVASGAIVLLLLGWKLRLREGSYGLILQGLGVALFYLVLFSAAKLYVLFTLELAFILMFLLVLFGSLLAVVQNALPLALFALTGGFLAPILTSDGSGSHITLFSYYALLDAGIVAIAWYRAWRILNLAGFFFTFVIATAWGILRYDTSLLESTEPFLILFFLFYVAIATLFTLRQPFSPRSFIDATLVFGLPLVAFSQQAALVHEIEYAVFYSAMAVGTLYLFLSKVLYGFEKTRMLAEAFLALGVVFYTMAVPYLLDDHLTGALWVLEGAAIIWVSLRQKRVYACIFGEFLQLLALTLFVLLSLGKETECAFFNVLFLEYAVVISALFLSAWLLQKHRERLSSPDSTSPRLFLLTALLTWLMAGWLETEKLLSIQQGNGMLIYVATGAALFALLAYRLKWNSLARQLQNYLAVGMLLLFTLLEHYELTHPFEELGWLALLLFFAMHYTLLFFFGKVWHQSTALHLMGLWLIALIAAVELQYNISNFSTNPTWHYIGWVLIPMLLAWYILKLKAPFVRFNTVWKEYRLAGVGGLAFMLFVWEIWSFSLTGDPSPLQYLPMLNPLDIAELTTLATILYWIYSNNIRKKRVQTLLYGLLALLVLALSSVIFARSVHFYREVAYTMDALGRNIFFQAGLSIIWSLLAMGLMLAAKHFSHRVLWISGMALLLLVVLKLFFIELANSGTVERIISFMAVGGLILLIGYFSPLPPREGGEES